MAAPEINLEPGSRRYTPLLLNDLFNNAYTGFKLTKLYDSRENKKSHIITGRWGSGAFGHNISMSIAVQYLAARLAGIEQLEFAGITSEQGSNVIEFVNHLIQDAYAAGSDSKNISAKILLLKILNHEHTKEWEVNSSHVSIDSRESTEQNTVFKLKLPPKRVKSSIKNIE
jgi:hypothetical protein